MVKSFQKKELSDFDLTCQKYWHLTCENVLFGIGYSQVFCSIEPAIWKLQNGLFAEAKSSFRVGQRWAMLGQNMPLGPLASPRRFQVFEGKIERLRENFVFHVFILRQNTCVLLTIHTRSKVRVVVSGYLCKARTAWVQKAKRAKSS